MESEKIEREKTSLSQAVIQLIKFLVKVEVKAHYLIFSAILSCLSVFLNLLVIRLLFPLAKGIINGDFSFLAESRIFQPISVFYLKLFGPMPDFFYLAITIFVIVIVKNIVSYAASLIIIYQAKAAVNNMRDHIL
ncbi:MAG: hypothetical protein PHV17_05890, partial [Candidatus Omnitrophica bacterium]|nr:hypothetical protein [Candidatus Omnitrophota bacterium]